MSFFKDVLQLPYASNSQDNPHHENQVEDLIKKYGFRYVSQPNGIQNSPDFYVWMENAAGEVGRYSIECKSSKGAAPTYNTGLPKPGVIYIFCSKKYNKTTIYWADDVVSMVKRNLYTAFTQEQGDLLHKYRSMAEWQEDERGFDFYCRAMYTQSGGAKKTDYFKHDDRERCENNVLEHFGEI
jgi:hypothetical protein